MTQHKTFMEHEIIKFDKIITNVGGGYIDESSNADYGKFIAPQNGTYQFNANLYNGNDIIGADLAKNGAFITANSNGGSGATSLSAVLDLVVGDDVYLYRPHWVANNAQYNKYCSSFSGVLLCTDA